MILMRRFVSVTVFLLLLYPAAAFAGPLEDVRQSVDAILSILKDKDMPKEESRKRISEIIHRRFDFEAMAQRTLGLNWRKASEPQRRRFTDLFASLLEQSYIDRIEAYTNEKVKYGNVQIREQAALVETSIITDTTQIPIHYKLMQKGDEWKVYDVVIEEVSLIRNYRDTYREIVKKEGFDGLFVKMEEKIAALKAGKEPG